MLDGELGAAEEGRGRPDLPGGGGGGGEAAMAAAGELDAGWGARARARGGGHEGEKSSVGEGRNTWFLYRPTWELLENKSLGKLKVESMLT